MAEQYPYAYGRPVIRGVIRQSVEDFVVEECLGFEPPMDDRGEHLWLYIEKRGQNTPWVATEIAKALGLHGSRASFAGLKDRHAITRQWMSFHVGQRAEIFSKDVLNQALSIEGVSVLSTVRASKKLMRGQLAGNRFELTLRDLEPLADASPNLQAELNDRLEKIAKFGVPNYFGEQRFGQDNLARARRLFQGELRGQRSKAKHGFYLSAARSHLFNQVLARRVADGVWASFLPGDVALLDGSQSFFVLQSGQENAPDILERLASFDIHPTGPMPGVGEAMVSGAVASLEEACFQPAPDLVAGLMDFKVKAMRRSLRAEVKALSWTWPDAQTLRLDFSLGAGAFATTVLRELIAYEP